MKEYEQHIYLCGKCGRIYDNDFGAFQCCKKSGMTKEEAEQSTEERKAIGRLYKKYRN